jgi:hypothetical protein
MKFALSFTDKFSALLPNSWRAQSRALENFNKKGAKRIAVNLTKRRQFVTAMQQDELKIAIQWAEQDDRPRRDSLYEIYRQTLRDGHTQGEVEKAINKVIGSPFAVFKKGGKEIDEQATRLLQREWFEEFRRYYEEARLWGHSLVQFVDKCESSESIIKEEWRTVDLIPREHVRPEEGFIVIDTSDDKGIPFRDPQIKKQFMLFEMGKPNNLGSLLIAAREVIWKSYSRSDWSRHSEKFGMPILVIRTDTTDKTALDDAEKMASEFGSNLWAILDKEDEIELKEPTFKDSYQIYKEKVLMCNDEVSKALTWQTGTSDEKAFVGSAEVHERVLNDFVEAAKRRQTYYINAELFPFLIEHGYPFKDKEFRYLSYQEANPDATQEEEQGQGEGGDPKPKKGNRPSYKDLLK